tara:strand:- start:101 stop:388 length:288 start_codon:yes stop_codon:yes gene_type:complete
MMDVWDPKDKSTVFCQIKKLISRLNLGLWGWGGMIVPGVLIIFYFIIFFFVLSGCSYFKKEKINNVVTLTAPPLLEMTDEQKITCIKLEPECDEK